MDNGAIPEGTGICTLDEAGNHACARKPAPRKQYVRNLGSMAQKLLKNHVGTRYKDTAKKTHQGGVQTTFAPMNLPWFNF